MKRYLLEFLRRGLVTWGFGPLVLAVVYLLIPVETVTVREVCTGFFSLSALAFLAGGMNSIYQVERLPLMVAILIHGSVLYVSYLLTYLINGWLEWGTRPFLVFSVIFAAGYLAIWVVIYAIIRKNTARINAMLKKKQQITE